MASLAVKEVEPIPHFLHTNGVLLSSMFQDELLEEEESPFMRNLLADLDESLPGVLRSEFSAIAALRVLDDVLHLEDLLEYCRCEDLRPP